MQTSNFKSAIASLALAPLMLALAACDQAQDGAPDAAVSPTGEAAPIPVATPATAAEDTAAPVAERPAEDASRNSATARRNAAPAPRQTPPPPSRAAPSPTAAATRAQPAPQTTQTADPHAGHDMQSMADHDMEGM